MTPDHLIGPAAALLAGVPMVLCALVTRRQKPKPADSALKQSVDEHWEDTPKGRRWDGSKFKRPAKGGEK